MRRVKAFLAALLLFLVTVGAGHLYVSGRTAVDPETFGTMPSEKKGLLRTALLSNLTEDSLPVFGSSEFMHGEDTPYHPAQVFAGTEVSPVLIGAGYYQCLSHAITLASIEEGLENRRAVLILSPQWFRKTGVVDQAFASRFSETHYANMIANEKLSGETKQYISDRTEKLLKVDEKTQKRVQRYDEVLWKQQGSWLESLREEGWTAFLEEKELFETALLDGQMKQQAKAAAGQTETETAKAAAAETAASAAGPDWDALYALAEKQGTEENQNPFYMDADRYEQLKPHLKKKKGINSDAVKGYQTGPEYDDLRCFLTVCQELGIEPMLVIVPVNGYYYDYTGFPKEARQKYYAKVREIAEEFGARVADFSDCEYTKYFFEDRVHLGKKGWLMVNESLYEFGKEA